MPNIYVYDPNGGNLVFRGTATVSGGGNTLTNVTATGNYDINALADNGVYDVSIVKPKAKDNPTVQRTYNSGNNEFQ